MNSSSFLSLEPPPECCLEQQSPAQNLVVPHPESSCSRDLTHEGRACTHGQHGRPMRFSSRSQAAAQAETMLLAGVCTALARTA
eukprot:1699749-Rhodomonas_salina.2